MDLRRITEEIDHDERLDPAVDGLQRAAGAVLPEGEVTDALRGKPLGHALHPALTDLPIGFWTSAWLLDLLGGRRSRPAADAFVGLGVLCALPTAATGLADWTQLPREKQRSGVVHLAANVAATFLYTASFLHRRRDHRVRGVLLGMAGAAAATAGGYLGGHLAFGGADADPRQASGNGHDATYVPDPALHHAS